MNIKFRNLRSDEIECRVGTINDKGFTLLLYKDARCDMNILDETGVIWTRRHYECKGNLFCEVGIYDSDLKQFVYRSDCGTESNTEKEKGEASDSFKRACVNWGIGRELYTTPSIRIKQHTKQKLDAKGNPKLDKRGEPIYEPTFKSIKIVEIGYSDDGKRITRLVISGDGDIIFEHGRKSAQSVQSATQAEPAADRAEKSEPARETRHSAPMTLEEARERQTKNGKRFADLPADQLQWIVDNAKNAESREAAQLVLDDRAFEDLPLEDDGELPF